MPLLQWEDDYSVGNETMDGQHKQLLSILNQLYDALQEGRGDQVLGQVITELAFYVQRHFAAEEQLMLDNGYPEEKLVDHRREHEVLLDQLRVFERRYASRDENVAANVLPFLLGDWLTKHILTIDRQYVPYLRGR